MRTWKDGNKSLVVFAREIAALSEDEELALVFESPAEWATCFFCGGVGGDFLLGRHGGWLI